MGAWSTFSRCIHSLSSNSRGVKKSACLRIVFAFTNRYLPWSGSRAQKYIVRHSNTVFSLVGLNNYMTAENNLLLRRIYFPALEPLLARRFLFIHAQKIFRQADFLRRNYYLINYGCIGLKLRLRDRKNFLNKKKNNTAYI